MDEKWGYKAIGRRKLVGGGDRQGEEAEEG